LLLILNRSNADYLIFGVISNLQSILCWEIQEKWTRIKRFCSLYIEKKLQYCRSHGINLFNRPYIRPGTYCTWPTRVCNRSCSSGTCRLSKSTRNDFVSHHGNRTMINKNNYEIAVIVLQLFLIYYNSWHCWVTSLSLLILYSLYMSLYTYIWKVEDLCIFCYKMNWKIFKLALMTNVIFLHLNQMEYDINLYWCQIRLDFIWMLE